MNREDEIKHLQAELDALKQQSWMQHQAIAALQQRLNQLTGGQVPAPQPKPFLSLSSWSLENFIGLRLIHFIGIIVLVIGLSIGVKYAIDRELISEVLRIGLAYAAGIVLYALSVRLKKAYAGFSAILFSGAMASLYFTTYAASVKYDMFGFAPAFVLMTGLTVYTSYEALRYNRQEIALLGLVGAYGIPFLISRNEDRADLFFLYITIINAGVLYLVMKKRWNIVGMAAQAITWMLFIGWAALRLPRELHWIGPVFMTVFFLLFQMAVLSAKIFRRGAFRMTDTYQLVLNNVAVYIAALFVFGFYGSDEHNLAAITLAAAALVALQALGIFRYWKEEHFTVRMLASMALILFVLFIAFNWDGFTVTFLWLLTAVVVFAWGFWKRSVRARMAAILLIGLTLGKLLAIDSLVFTSVQKVIAYLVLGVLLLVVSFFYQKFRGQIFGDKD